MAVQYLSECVPDAELACELIRRSVPFAPGAEGTLFNQGEACVGAFLLTQGTAKLGMLSRSSDGSRVMCFHAKTGALIGLPAALGHEPYSMLAVLDPGGEVRRIHLEDLEAVLLSQPKFSMQIIRILAFELKAAREVIRDGFVGESGSKGHSRAPHQITASDLSIPSTTCWPGFSWALKQ
jgi:CRP-like cAMP-binding protein